MSKILRGVVALCFAMTWFGCQTGARVGKFGSESVLTVYPEAEPLGDSRQAQQALVLNPRLPCVPTTNGGYRGKCLAVDAGFAYRLSPWVAFPQGGRVSLAVRDNLLRRAKEVLALTNGKTTVSLEIGTAEFGRIPALAVTQDGQKPVKAELAFKISGTWLPLEIRWDQQRVWCLAGGQEAGALELPRGFAPTSLRLRAYSVDELAVGGAGSLQLGWEHGYRAVVVPTPTATALEGRLFGFDTLVVSQNRGARDCPMVQVLSAGGEGGTATFDFDVRSEVRGISHQWQQSVPVRGVSTTMIPVEFPFPLATDVYHLRVKSHGLSRELDSRWNFMYVERRAEPAGPVKFGLHSGGGPRLGTWPDALPIGLYHYYAGWGYIQGPVWVKEHGEYGLDPSVPTAEWNWDPHIDWAVAQGLEPYVCINAAPLLPWMYDKLYKPNGMPGPWPSANPKDELYRRFMHALAERYKGKVRRYEIQNEPNAYPPGGYPPEDYVAILKAAYEEIHAVAPDALVYGICGTSNFIPWMTKVFEAGGAQYMDRVSFHTYTTPALPDRAGLAERLAEVRALATKYGKPLRFLNSETGTYTALREVADRPVPSKKLAELIKQGAPAYSVPRGWPNYALSEQMGALSEVRNAILNFVGGAECFTFFRWSPDFPPADWWKKGADACFAAMSCDQHGERTPSLYTLSLGVLTAQMEGALPFSGVPAGDADVDGGIFKKANGGQVAVLWSPRGKRSLVLQTSDRAPEVVSLFGVQQALRATTGGNRHLYRLELTEQPTYIHVKSADLKLLPSPVIDVREISREGNGYRMGFTLVNRYGEPWAGKVEVMAPAGWRFEPSPIEFDVAAGKQAELVLECTVPPETKRGLQAVEASLKLPDGSLFSFPIPFSVRPNVKVPRLPESMTLAGMGSWEMPGGALRLDRPEQVVVGRPPLLSSLQEEGYWKGPAELSGTVKIGYTEEALMIYVKAHDANARVPARWPGVGGSCVEFFFDFRGGSGRLGRGPYERGVYQVILRPSLAKGEPVEIWHASKQYGVLAGVTADGGHDDAQNYWVALRIPWADVPDKVSAGYPLNFDVGIDGCTPDKAGRKSQIMLFGGSDNNLNASNFGSGTLGGN